LLQSGQFNEDMIPTVGFNMRKVTKGNVTIKVCNINVIQWLVAVMVSICCCSCFLLLIWLLRVTVFLCV